MRRIAFAAAVLSALSGCGPAQPGTYQPIDWVGAFNAANLAYWGAYQPPPPQIICNTTYFGGTSRMVCR